MPIRKYPLNTNEIYHIFNKTIDNKNIFINYKICNYFYNLSRYYRSEKGIISYSNLHRLSNENRNDYIKKITMLRYHRVEIISYNLMPNHFHFILKQKKDKGISVFISNVINSLTKIYNKQSRRLGPVFLPRFKSVLVETDEQLIHLSRYIHLNQYSSKIFNNKEDLLKYPWSSFHEYIENPKKRLSNDKMILSLFNDNRNRYKNFVLDNADWQRTRELIKYMEKYK
ncbi:hypothetical protein COV24_02665 [candidate division WWE3 bacterium CG10_big_fil_rev_8_21_14_0_10_32_10]|uniref:Transposase IS200-like domain-containing protein n=1 Tax=candidate division WWE3 bacterium CG10_big_fil_rev_8_21_14_0_10_32_10 TaxID=1975090 RepID=A0A2H0RA65_UNCKA|nr:MAG: hypothetical protein COV24_02665 [candidate division WWE3 bacterium CG10_big_fil_rev_8_21_14_0_10_32_10]